MFSFLQTSSEPVQDHSAIGLDLKKLSALTDRGVLIAISVIGTWAISLGVLLSIDVSTLPIVLQIAAILWQTFLYTGLFITAHDAMHGAVSPSSVKVNNFFGNLALRVYALFSLKEMTRTHWMHHQHPASEQDPDFHDGQHKNFFAWYSYFMVRYWSWTRIIGLVVIFHLLHRVLHVPEINLTLFWAVPSIASSIQLFFFGTYLPHREPEGGYQNQWRAQSSTWSPFWSFITCYHFGYHEEHHAHPHLPWWKLPEMHQQNLVEANR